MQFCANIYLCRRRRRCRHLQHRLLEWLTSTYFHSQLHSANAICVLTHEFILLWHRQLNYTKNLNQIMV